MARLLGASEQLFLWGFADSRPRSPLPPPAVAPGWLPHRASAFGKCHDRGCRKRGCREQNLLSSSVKLSLLPEPRLGAQEVAEQCPGQM